MNRSNIYRNIKYHIRRCRDEVIKLAIMDISKSLKSTDIKDIKQAEEYINKEIKNRTLNSKVRYMGDFEKTFKIKYFDINYLINKDKIL